MLGKTKIIFDKSTFKAKAEGKLFFYELNVPDTLETLF